MASDRRANAPPPRRVMLWIDGVGGYLVELADAVTIGQPGGPNGGRDDAPAGVSHLAVLADLSGRHARLARVDGRYVLTPYGECRVGGRGIDGPCVLDDGAAFTLGSVGFALRRPHALSATALLTVTSGHRTVPSADAVLLMAESCVLGAKAHCHVRVPTWADEAILFRSAGGLSCRSTGALRAAGADVAQPAALTPGVRIEGQDWSLAVEEAPGC